MQVYLKSPKEARLSDGVVVDLFFTAWFFCPVVAFKKYLASLPFSPAASSSVTRTIKQYLKQNIRVEKTKLNLDSPSYDSNPVVFRREYAESTAMYLVVSGLWQHQTNLWMIRKDNHSGVLIFRMLHDVKFSLPTLLVKFTDKATRDKKQLEVVRYFVDSDTGAGGEGVRNRNRSQGGAGAAAEGALAGWATSGTAPPRTGGGPLPYRAWNAGRRYVVSLQ